MLFLRPCHLLPQLSLLIVHPAPEKSSVMNILIACVPQTPRT